jgi:hypothetical protein
MAKKNQKAAADLRQMLAAILEIDPDGDAAVGIGIYPLQDTWRAMSARSDDKADFRSQVIKASILLAERYDLEL